MKLKKRIVLPAASLAVLLIATLFSGGATAAPKGSLTIYFTRHGEKMTTLVDIDGAEGGASFWSTDGSGAFIEGDTVNPEAERLDEACTDSKCAEELSPLGELRAELLAEYFVSKRIAPRLDAVYATHKTRTQQTVQPTADVAGLTLETFPKFDSDGVTPASELAPDSTTPSECPTIQAIWDARDAGMDTILVAGHSGTLFDIMGDGNGSCDGLGLNTDSQLRFPKKADGKVANFGDVWKVVITPNGKVRFAERVQLEFKLTIGNRAG